MILLPNFWTKPRFSWEIIKKFFDWIKEIIRVFVHLPFISIVRVYS